MGPRDPDQAHGDSMTTVPATTDMHYRIGGIAETFMSTLLLMLVEQGRIKQVRQDLALVPESPSRRPGNGADAGGLRGRLSTT